MLFLDILTILCVTLMTGNELAVSLFVNPAIWQLEERAQVNILRILARTLGSFMPVWYIVSLLFMGAEAVLRRHQPSMLWLLVAAALWIGVIVYTLTSLVPINNRIAALDPANPSRGWNDNHHTWDARHRLRILILVIASACLSYGILTSH